MFVFKALEALIWTVSAAVRLIKLPARSKAVVGGHRDFQSSSDFLLRSRHASGLLLLLSRKKLVGDLSCRKNLIVRG